MAAGVGTLVLGHTVRARTDQDAAKALNLAEAALNYQIQRITAAGLSGVQTRFDGSNAAIASYGAPPRSVWPVPTWSTAPGNPRPLPIPAELLSVGGKTLHGFLDLKNVNTGNGDGDVWVAWVEPALDPYNDSTQAIYGAATVNGVTRVVRVNGGWGEATEGTKGIFDDQALFGMRGIPLGGNFTVHGAIGSSGAITLGGSASVDDGVLLYGPGASFNSGKSRLAPRTYPTALQWPTITTIANQVASSLVERGAANRPGYYDRLTTNRGIRNFGPAPSGVNDNALGSYKKDSKGAWIAGLPGNGDLPADTIRLVGKPWGANYYLTDLSHDIDIAADIKDGPVILWIDMNQSGQIHINAKAKIRAYNSATNPDVRDDLLRLEDAAQFLIYYVNRDPSGQLHINGAAQFYALFYAYDVIDGTPVGAIRLNGNATYNGSIIAYTLVPSNGNATINYPPNHGLTAGEGLLHYGWRGPWQEVNPVRGN